VLNFAGVDSFTYVATDTAFADSNTATVTINVLETIDITSAQYRIRQNRWRVEGNVSDPSGTVEVYMCTDVACTTPQFIGTANVDPIDGSWSFNSTGATSPPDPQNSPVWVVAMTPLGAISEPPTLVTIRR
jgi:hypothetical protein